MYPVSFDSPHRSPLDFNTDRTDRVAEAPGDGASGPDAESLLAELGLFDRAVREALTSSSIPSV